MIEDRCVRLNELAVILGISKCTIYRLIKRRKFPQQIHLTNNISVWRLSVINEWIDEREKLGR